MTTRIQNDHKKIFTRGLGKRPRGRQRRINPSWVVGSAETYRVQIANAWPKVGNQLLAAQSRDEIVRVLDGTPGGLIAGIVDNRKFATLLFEIIHDPAFPKVRTNSQIRFLADSLGGSGVVKPRRSRDICAEERAKMKRPTTLFGTSSTWNVLADIAGIPKVMPALRVARRYCFQCSLVFNLLERNRACRLLQAADKP